jgi:hypothetical protein
MRGGMLGRLWKIGRIALRPPAPEPGRHEVAIAAIVRDEERHIGEWARFHALARVRAFLIYDDGSTDATVPVLRAVLRERLTVVPWRQRLSVPGAGWEIHNQVLAYAHAAGNFGGAFRWMAFIDADEFLVPKRAASVPDALAHLGGCANLSLPWHMFGHCGHDEPPAGGIVANYTGRAADPMSDRRGLRAFKAIVDPCRLTAVRVHAMETEGDTRSCNDRGDSATLRGREARGFYSADHLQLNHYYARSRAELDAKIARGPNLRGKADAYGRKVRRTLANIEAETVEDRSALDYLARIGAPDLADGRAAAP